ncbi:hypothetical protein A5765_22980 [Mycolicibacterium celeriflavum]|uniref:Uncharacterized protein n=1 Tax=Mycolicibacterium celeriflavum TaxID=1249101 RepID=A0A1X0BT19_MYCCF|nr:hypothetical protein [Mycolicibacterium celeriflavum]MCV7238471.1 hypothetical protein [Mycolicibacterium celeriflavum]OBG20518.1 hypothetical protein A5765_22980 [Mycolicibacterium celeriflavum]ORA46683.1 hypothetical protein BST21_14585 [Mycolicibacterium celeriflavum]BBY44719.1 hypothetical protein MCEL_30140 [Mycolicibacterium celeriflavum]
MTVAHAIATAATFVWLGMVVAISFIEAPLKFRAPGVSIQIGLGIGRLVFRALNTIEVALAVILLIAILLDGFSTTAVVAIVVAVVVLAVQLVAVRPALNRRSDAVLSTPPAENPSGHGRSRAHYGYVGLETVKVIALIVGGVALLV